MTKLLTSWGECLEYTRYVRPGWKIRNGKPLGATSQGNQINSDKVSEIVGLRCPITKLTRDRMRALMIELEDTTELSPSTINKVVGCVSTVLDTCYENEKINFKRPKYFRYKTDDVGRVWWFTKEQVARIVECAAQIFDREDLADIVQFAAFHGLRQSEIFKLKAKDIDFVDRGIHVGGRPGFKTKAQNYRFVPFHESCESMLAERSHGAHPDLQIFGDEWNDRFQLLDVFRKPTRYLGIDDCYVFHCLRHSFGTWHAAAGTPLRTLQELMGHKRIETTIRYAKCVDQTKFAAQAAI